MTARQDPVPIEERLAQVLEHLAAECRKLVGSSGSALALLGQHEAQCSSTPESAMPTSPTPGALMTRREVADLLRIDLRTLDRWRSDPAAKFPEPVRRGRVLRWRRTAIERWLATRAP